MRVVSSRALLRAGEDSVTHQSIKRKPQFMLIDKAKNTPALSQSGDYISSLAGGGGGGGGAEALRLPEVPPAQAEQRWNPAILCCLFLMVDRGGISASPRLRGSA